VVIATVDPAPGGFSRGQCRSKEQAEPVTVAVHLPLIHFILDAFNSHSMLIVVRIGVEGIAVGHSGAMGLRAELLCFPAIGLLVIGCSSDMGASGPATGSTRAVTPPAEPATAAAPAVPPSGTVVSLGNAPEGIVVGTSGVGATAVRNPDGVVLIDATTGAVRQTVPTRGAARHLSLAGPDGPVLAPLESSNELCELSLADGRVISTAVGVGRQPHDAVLTAGGTIVVTSELGGGVVFVRDATVLGSLPAGPVQPGGIAGVDGYAAVADVQGNGVWVYDATTRRQVAHSPVGAKLTHAVALPGDLAAFADTDGGAVFIERIDPQVAQVARVDAPGKPYGLAYDAGRRRLYVTLTAANLLRVVDVSDAEKPRILGDVPTVQQPNSVAVDPRSGGVLVTGSAPGSRSRLQIIPASLLPGGRP
jgi:DNA-binding beta-propeller fold protein YncE